MKIRTMKQALVEARKRWGKNAAVQVRKTLALPYSVGLIIWMGMAMEDKGQGKTWDEAFANYDEKVERAREEFVEEEEASRKAEAIAEWEVGK